MPTEQPSSQSERVPWRREYEVVRQERGDLRAAGDRMQSEFSRVIEWLNENGGGMPYEVRMAVLEGESAIEAWTATRRGSR